MTDQSPEHYLSAPIRERLEQTYYQRVTEQAQLEYLLDDARFMQDVGLAPAFFADHGVVHVRDVARQVLRVLQTINGVLIPRRSAEQMETFLLGYGVALAYLHDIGMTDLTAMGRHMHPEYAAQAVFDGSLDDVLSVMWAENSGNLACRITQLVSAGVVRRHPQLILRELLSMTVCHSKSKVPATVLDDPAALRQQMQTVVSHNLHALYAQQQTASGQALPLGFTYDAAPPTYLARFYADVEQEAYDWLTDGSDGARQLTSDVVDVLRALRAADAFRQRGTVLRTSGGHEMFVSQRTGNCVISMYPGGGRLFLIEVPENSRGAGEANIACSEFTREGDLSVTFHRGSFDSARVRRLAAHSAADVVEDLVGDAVQSFWRKSPIPGVKSAGDMRILLESTGDDPYFVELVRNQLSLSVPGLAHQIEITPSLKYASEIERARYLDAQTLNWDAHQRQAVLDRIAQAGQKLASFDPVAGFRHVKLAELQAGETLITADSPSSFVYFPLAEGLKVIPLGGYRAVSVAAWIPLGTTGVIRGNVRNADVVAEQPVSVLIVPREVYLRHWYAPYSPQELKELLYHAEA